MSTMKLWRLCKLSGSLRLPHMVIWSKCRIDMRGVRWKRRCMLPRRSRQDVVSHLRRWLGWVWSSELWVRLLEVVEGWGRRHVGYVSRPLRIWKVRAVLEIWERWWRPAV